MVFVRGLIKKRLENLETKLSETVWLKLAVSNKKSFILFHIDLLKKVINICLLMS